MLRKPIKARQLFISSRGAFKKGVEQSNHSVTESAFADGATKVSRPSEFPFLLAPNGGHTAKQLQPIYGGATIAGRIVQRDTLVEGIKLCGTNAQRTYCTSIVHFGWCGRLLLAGF